MIRSVVCIIDNIFCVLDRTPLASSAPPVSSTGPRDLKSDHFLCSPNEFPTVAGNADELRRGGFVNSRWTLDAGNPIVGLLP